MLQDLLPKHLLRITLKAYCFKPSRNPKKHEREHFCALLTSYAGVLLAHVKFSVKSKYFIDLRRFL